MPKTLSCTSGASPRRLLVPVAALCLALTGPVGAADLTEVVFALPTPYAPTYSYFMAAQELGFYEQEGIKATFQELAGGATVMAQVGTKGVAIGAATPDPLIIANQPGKSRVPVKFFYNSTRIYNWEFAVPENSPVKAVADLKGKTLGVSALTNSHMPITRLIMRDNGLTVDKDYKILAIGAGAPAFKALQDGQVDAFNTFMANVASYEAVGTKLRRLDIPERYKKLFQNSFFAHEDMIKEKPELLAGWGRATTKGVIVCQIATEWCLKNFWKHYPTLKPRTGNEDEIARQQADSLRTGWKPLMTFDAGKPRRFGEYPEGGWQNYLEVLFEGGAITEKADPSTLYTNDLVPKMNDFDVAAIEKQAQGLK